MSDVFISYARKNKIIVLKIVEALKARDFDVWIDLEDIPRGEDWQQEIYRGIEEADAFLFMVSPDSVISEPCNNEIAHAIKNRKRTLPIFIADVADGDIYKVVEKFPHKAQKEEINRLNFVICREGRDDFDKAIDEIQTTIHTDYEWLKYHTRLQVRALEWERKPDASLLLRGKELREAEERLGRVGSQTEPLPTELQKLYITGSQRHEKILKRRYILISTLAILALLVSMAWSTLTRERAVPGNWVTIPAGEFTMGMDQKEAEAAFAFCQEGALDSDKESCTSAEDLLAWSGMIENVKLPEFDIMDNEVTNAQYQQCIDTGKCVPPLEWKYDKGGANKPATGLNWFQAREYCTWLGGRLPTEVEWERTASGPDGSNHYFPWGNDWDLDKANLERSGVGEIQSIVQYAGSDISYYGIKNLAGNAREWTASESVSLDADVASTNSVLSLDDDSIYYPVIVRGGAWNNERSTGMSSMRGTDGTLSSRDTLSFRCVCPVGQTCNSPWNWRWVWFGKY